MFTRDFPDESCSLLVTVAQRADAGEWPAGSGTATYGCRRGKGTIRASFQKLVPNGVYTFWYAFAGKGHMGCGERPFTTIDFPMGDPDGSQSAFTADANGSADYDLTFSPCLELSRERRPQRWQDLRSGPGSFRPGLARAAFHHAAG